MKNCPSCGALNQDENLKCVRCGFDLTVEAESPGPNPPLSSHLAEAVLCTIFCCQPFGIVAIVYAAQVNGFLQSGNFQAAAQASQKAKDWCSYAFWAAVIPYFVIGVFKIIGAFLH